MIVENTYRTQVVDHAYIETESGVGMIDRQGNLVIWSANQCPSATEARSPRSSACGKTGPGYPGRDRRRLRRQGRRDRGGPHRAYGEGHGEARPARSGPGRVLYVPDQTTRHRDVDPLGGDKEGKFCAMEGKSSATPAPMRGSGHSSSRSAASISAAPTSSPTSRWTPAPSTPTTSWGAPCGASASPSRRWPTKP